MPSHTNSRGWRKLRPGRWTSTDICNWDDERKWGFCPWQPAPKPLLTKSSVSLKKASAPAEGIAKHRCKAQGLHGNLLKHFDFEPSHRQRLSLSCLANYPWFCHRFWDAMSDKVNYMKLVPKPVPSQISSRSKHHKNSAQIFRRTAVVPW